MVDNELGFYLGQLKIGLREMRQEQAQIHPQQAVGGAGAPRRRVRGITKCFHFICQLFQFVYHGAEKFRLFSFFNALPAACQESGFFPPTFTAR